jgi:ABC-type uncharacterized transport system involved in gliding motility auxiliary subunit
MKVLLKLISQNILMVLLLAGIFGSLNYLSDGFNLRFDLTEDKEFTLAESTKKIMQRFEDRLTIKLYYSADLPHLLKPVQERVADLLSELQAQSKQTIIIEQVDPDSNEDKERETTALGIAPLQINIIEKDKREIKKVFMGMAMYYQDKKEVIPAVAQVQNLEYQLDLMMLKLTQKDLPKIGVYIGENQDKHRLMKPVVQQIGQVVEITTATKDISDLDLAALIIVAPKNLSKERSTQIDSLLKQGTNVMLFTSHIGIDDALVPSQINSGLDDWLADKGLGISDQLLIDAAQNEQAGFHTGQMQVFMAYPFWPKALQKDLNKESPITAQLEEVFYPWTNVIQIFSDEESEWNISTLTRSSNRSFLQQEDVPTVSPQYIQGMTKMPNLKSHPLSVVLSQSKEGHGKLFVTANSHMLQDRFLRQVPSNVLFIENMLEYASWGEFLIGVRSRGKTARPIAEITAATKSLIKWGHMVLIPLLSVLFGMLILYIIKKQRQRLITRLT